MTTIPGIESWSLMETHGVVLFHVAAHPDITMRKMSEDLDLTERRISQVIKDLAVAGMLSVTRTGRRNTYAINGTRAFGTQPCHSSSSARS